MDPQSPAVMTDSQSLQARRSVRLKRYREFRSSVNVTILRSAVPPVAMTPWPKKIRRRKPPAERIYEAASVLRLHARLHRFCRDRQRADAGAAGVEDRV